MRVPDATGPETGAARWTRATYLPAKARSGERRERFVTESGIDVGPLYGPQDPDPGLGFPGEPPFTRGIQATMYRGRLWTMRQYAGFATPEESNERYRYLLAQGQTGLSVAFDLPTQTGYDCDDEAAYGETGKVGVSVSSLADMEALFEGIPLGGVTTSMTINATAPVLLAMYVAVARKQGVPLSQVGGTTQNDVLKEYIARGTYVFPPGASVRLATDLIAYCAAHLPQWNPISISGYHMREAGATAPQEVAFTIANAIAYVESATRAGMAVDDFAPRLSFFFAAHNNLFEEVAKFRAARRLWADVARSRLGAKDPRSCMLRFHTQTAGVTLQAQQPEVNAIRTTVQALAAVLGGTQSLHVNASDEALGLPSEGSARLALRTQQVLAHESGVTETIDPLGGSYYVEHLTDAIEAAARGYLTRIDEMGGAVRAIALGFQRQQIEDAAFAHLRAVESGERVVVGVNAYEENGGAPGIAGPRVDPGVAGRQAQRLRQVRARRDGAMVREALRGLAEAASTRGVNTMPAMLTCVEAYATLGEITGTLRGVFGEHAV